MHPPSIPDMLNFVKFYSYSWDWCHSEPQLGKCSSKWNKIKNWMQNIKSQLKQTLLFQERDATHKPVPHIQLLQV
jgi:hypothetical protein